MILDKNASIQNQASEEEKMENRLQAESIVPGNLQHNEKASEITINDVRRELGGVEYPIHTLLFRKDFVTLV